jgi:hypothetical protein
MEHKQARTSMEHGASNTRLRGIDSGRMAESWKVALISFKTVRPPQLAELARSLFVMVALREDRPFKGRHILNQVYIGI